MSKKPARDRLYVVTGVVVLVVILIAAVSTVLWLKQGKEAEDTTKAPTNTAQLSPEEAEQKRLGRQVEDARAEELQRLISSEADKPKKAEYLIELSLIHFNRGNFEQALSLALEAEGQVKTANTAALLGDIYFAMKDYDQAAKQYGAAMDRSEKSAPGERSPYNEYAILKKKAEDAQ